jgi:ORF6N domain
MKNIIVPKFQIENKMYWLRGRRVMFDVDLAQLYGVPTKILNQSVKRNLLRFPGDFMFVLTGQELENWRSQIVTSNPGAKMGLRRPPYAFTEQGVAMLSSVLNSERAIQVNIQIMRTFTKIREMLVSNKELREKIEKLEMKYDQKFIKIFQVIKELLAVEIRPKNKIGFRTK